MVVRAHLVVRAEAEPIRTVSVVLALDLLVKLDGVHNRRTLATFGKYSQGLVLLFDGLNLLFGVQLRQKHFMQLLSEIAAALVQAA